MGHGMPNRLFQELIQAPVTDFVLSQRVFLSFTASLLLESLLRSCFGNIPCFNLHQLIQVRNFSLRSWAAWAVLAAHL